MTCIWCNRCSRCPNISTSSTRASPAELDFSFSGPQALAAGAADRRPPITIGAIHTYLELFSRYFIDLTPHVALVAAEAADRRGNLYTGANTEDTPVIVEATAFKGGIVVAQVNRIVDDLPRVDIPADWVGFVVQSPRRITTWSRCSRGIRRRSPKSRC